MLKKIKKNEVGICCFSLVIFFMICFALYYVRMNRHVQFQDKNMAYEISRTIGPNVNPENVKYKDVYAIKELNIGQLGKYDTLEDIKLCKNLRILTINGGGDKWKPLKKEEDIDFLLYEQAQKYQKELSDIVPSLKRIEIFSFSNYLENCNISNFDFLAKCCNMKVIKIYDSTVSDFGFLKNCSKVKEIYLWGSNIKDADDLKSLKNLETICIYDTPLSKDETEVESLCKAFPNAKIFISEDKVQNIDIKEE